MPIHQYFRSGGRLYFVQIDHIVVELFEEESGLCRPTREVSSKRATCFDTSSLHLSSLCHDIGRYRNPYEVSVVNSDLDRSCLQICRDLGYYGTIWLYY
jgi:hypothetical protein